MSDTVLVAVIGAFATVLTALFQIFMSSRQSASGARSTRNRIKGLIWTVVLLVAAAAGGFGYSEYLVLTKNANLAAFHDRVGNTLFAANAAPQPAPPASSVPAMAPLLPGPEAMPTRDDVTATVTLPACKSDPAHATACTEMAAAPVALCVPVPAAARVTEVQLYSRLESSTLPWSDHRVAAGQDVGAGRFVEAHFERPDGDRSKDVCQKFAHWNAETGRSVRIVVQYDLEAPMNAQGASPTPAPKPTS